MNRKYGFLSTLLSKMLLSFCLVTTSTVYAQLNQTKLEPDRLVR